MIISKILLKLVENGNLLLTHVLGLNSIPGLFTHNQPKSKYYAILLQIDFWNFLTTLQHQKLYLWHFSCYRAEIFTTDPSPVLFKNTVVNFFFKLTFDHLWPGHCFHARELKFSPQVPCLLFFKSQWSQFLKIKFWPFLTFDHFATSKMHLAMFHARGLKFSPQTPCLLFFKTQWSILFKLNYDLFWPLYNMKNAYFAIFETTL